MGRIALMSAVRLADHVVMRSSVQVTLLAAAAAVMAACAGGTPAVSIETIEQPGTSSTAPASTSTAASGRWQDDVTPASAPLPSITIGDGIHRVGVDADAGEYLVTGGETCTYTITVHDTGEPIASVSGAVAETFVTVADGQRVTTTGCGYWSRTDLPEDVWGPRSADAWWYGMDEPGRWQSCVDWNTSPTRDDLIGMVIPDEPPTGYVDAAFGILARDCDDSQTSMSVDNATLAELTVCRAHGLAGVNGIRNVLADSPPADTATVDHVVAGLDDECVDPDYAGHTIVLADFRADPTALVPVVPPNPYQWQTTFPVASAGPHDGFLDGTFTVGTDIVPGTYRSFERGGFDCVWQHMDPGGVLIADYTGLPQDGVKVTLEDRQLFTSMGCGGWMLTPLEQSQIGVVTAELLWDAFDTEMRDRDCEFWKWARSPEHAMALTGGTDDYGAEFLAVLARECDGPPGEWFAQADSLTDDKLSAKGFCTGYLAVGAARIGVYLGEDGISNIVDKLNEIDRVHNDVGSGNFLDAVADLCRRFPEDDTPTWGEIRDLTALERFLDW